MAIRAIFISYRRNDAEGEAGRLFDDLVREFGEHSVFMDVAAIQPGRDFRKIIDESVATCGVLLAVIGAHWLDSRDESGNRRLDDPSDFVRLETASALKRDIPVIPVLVRGAKIPQPQALPEDLKELAYRNAVELTHARWNGDLQFLMRALRPLLDTQEEQAAVSTPSAAGEQRTSVAPVARSPSQQTQPQAPRSSVVKWVIAGVLLLLISVGGYFFMSGSNSSKGELNAEPNPAKPDVGPSTGHDGAGAGVSKDTPVSPPPAGKDAEPPAQQKLNIPTSELSISNVHSEQCLSPAGGNDKAGVELVQYKCDSDLSRYWRFVLVDRDLIQIKNAFSGLCIAVSGASKELNMPIVQESCDTDPSARWRYTPVNETTFLLVNVRTDRCLTIAGGTKNLNQTAVQYLCDGDPSRSWQVVHTR